MDVVLIAPPHVFDSTNMWKNINRCLPPLGLASIAAFLEGEKISVSIIDVAAQGLTLENLVQQIEKIQPRFIGLGAATVLIEPAKTIGKALKQALPQTKIVFGGVHATIFPEELLNLDFVDFVVRGEGEYTMAELVKGYDVEKILGLSYKDGKKIVHNLPRPVIEDIDSLPHPAYHLLPMKDYRPSTGNYRRMPAASFMTSRGCPGRCTFCYTGVNGPRTRFHKAEYILEEIELLIKDYGIKEISFYDDTFTAFKSNVVKLCNLILEKDIDITWSCMSRVDMVDFDLLKLMKRAGCHQVGYGIESADQKILENIKKRVALEKVKSVIRDTRRAGITTRGMFMFGNPGETVESMEKTLKFALSLRCDIGVFNITTPYPGTEMFQWADKNGYLLTKDWSKYDLSRSVMHLPTVEPGAVEHYYRMAYKRFYMRPIFILKKIFSLRSISDVTMSCKFFISMVKEWLKIS
jgi:anaerobic magnesium-protoporphyrin IX monomethyl ester cyclase